MTIRLAGMTMIAMLFAPISFANCCWIKDPYLGFELIQTNLNFQEGYGKNIFYKNPLDWNLFGGFKFSRHFGVELGYEAGSRRGSMQRVGPGGTLPGNIPVTAGQFTTMETTSQITHPYAGLFGEYACWCVRWQALFGFSATHIKARTAILATQAGNNSQAAYNASVRNYSQTKLIPMLKFSGIYNFTKCFAGKVSFLYRNTSQIKVYPTQGGNQQIRLRDSVGVGIGLMYYFK